MDHGEQIDELLVAVPYSTEHYSAVRLHLDLNLTADQARQLRRLTEALDKKQVRLRSGHRVANYNGSIRWLLEQLESAAEEANSATPIRKKQRTSTASS